MSADAEAQRRPVYAYRDRGNGVDLAASTYAHDEIATLRQELAEARAKAERDHIELRDRRTEDDELRGILSPNGRPFGRIIPFELGPTLVPAVEWLIAQVEASHAG